MYWCKFTLRYVKSCLLFGWSRIIFTSGRIFTDVGNQPVLKIYEFIVSTCPAALANSFFLGINFLHKTEENNNINRKNTSYHKHKKFGAILVFVPDTENNPFFQIPLIII
jgi:hypothetical protein